MISRFLLCVALLNFFSISFADAERFPACLSNASDSDVDGYGWENNKTCIVDTSPIGPAFFTNLETGLNVSLTRAYWNHFDFNKDVVCSAYSFDGIEYQRIDASITGYQFSPMSLTPPYVGEVSVVHSFNSNSVIFPWAVTNGRYIGPSDLGRSLWMEIVINVWDQSAVRIWFLDQTYTQCEAVNPNDFFLPTGSPSVAGECIDSDGDGWGWNGVASCIPEGDYK